MYYEDLNQLEKSICYQAKSIRVVKGVSQAKVAEVLGVSFQQVQKYENGKNRISPGKLVLLADYFNVPVSSFFENAMENKKELLSSQDLEVLRIFKSIKSDKARRKVIELCKVIDQFED